MRAKPTVIFLSNTDVPWELDDCKARDCSALQVCSTVQGADQGPALGPKSFRPLAIKRLFVQRGSSSFAFTNRSMSYGQGALVGL